ncbi:MAG: VOC family protein [Candidatus Latescibacteria bacterium]|nr:VOC family protein [Candidatus Latescibacterota bacterium]
MITGIGHIAITSSDIDASLDFYNRILVLPEAFRMHNDDGSLWMVYLKTGNGDFIEIFTNGGDTPDIPNNASGFKHLCLWVDDLEATLNDLKSRGLDVDPGNIRTGRSKCRQYFIADPDDVRIELMQLMPDSNQAQALNA